jgi:hypothetical protein
LVLEFARRLPANANGIGFSPNEIIDALSIIYIQKMEAQKKRKKKKEGKMYWVY